MQNPWELQLQALGSFLRAQRKLAKFSLRELASRTNVSNAYISQLERGLHEPSLHVLRSIAEALGIPPATLLAYAGLGDEDGEGEADEGTEGAIRTDPHLTESQKDALLAVYRSFVDES